jgi:hypothetical protein
LQVSCTSALFCGIQISQSGTFTGKPTP